MAVERQSTGIEGLDRLLGGGIPRGSRCLLIGPHGSGLTVFAMQFLWAGLKAGETVSYDVWDRPWPKLRAYFESFGWNVGPYEESRRLLPIQSFPHFDPYPRDPRVRYFALADFEEMKRIDLDLTQAGVSRFVFGDSYEHIFHEGEESRWHEVEQWTVSWTHHDRITNFDLVHETTAREPQVQRLMDFTLLLTDNILRFRAREARGRWRRELRIERMEGVAHPLDWLPFEITSRGIRLIETGAGFRKR